MKKRKILSILLAVCLLAGILAPMALAVEDVPELSARQALLVDLNSGYVYYTQGADERAYPASLTKIMTVLLALEAVDRGEISLKDEITAGDDCMNGLDEESSSAGIQPGEIMTFENYLYCAMISSANEACNVIASAVAGSIDAFVQRMNDRAAELGCTGTHFMNPHGMPDENHYTTANDLYRITSEALKHDLFFSMSNTLTKTIPATNKSDTRTLQNTNGLINPDSIIYPGYLYEGAAGVKTGHTNAAGYCLVSTAERNSIRLLCVILGAGEGTKDNGTAEYKNFTDTIKLYDWAFNNFSVRTLVSSSELLCDVPVLYGSDADRVTAHAREDLTAVLPNDAAIEDYERTVTIYSERDNEPLQAPVESGAVLGEVTITKDGITYGSVPIISSYAVDLSRGAFLRQGMERFFSKPIVLIILLVILAVIILYIILMIRYNRRRRRRAAEARRRRMQQEQARQRAAVRREYDDWTSNKR